MAYHSMPPLLRRWLAGVLAAQLGLGPLATPAYAALTPLADEPLAVRNSAKPNIVLTVDDSTSMLFDFLPDYVVSAYCRGGTGSMTAACGNLGAANDFTLVGGGKYSSPGYTYQQYTYPYSKYTGTYDAAGPGAGCFPGSPPTCSQAIDPGALPGVATYPAGPQPNWPNSGKPYEYWLMWPAPAHSAGLNALYYDPRLTYDPPVDSTGKSYDEMDAAHTSNWTQVPGDPWAFPPPAPVDLTATVTDGLWCNSDWSLGSAADPTQCRYNGTGAAGFKTVSLADGQDYTYPWAPPTSTPPLFSFTVSASAGATTTSTYAAQKVTLDGTLTGTAINAANWNATSRNEKYFYENENILWCDPTSPSWPQTGPTQPQTCGNLVQQLCSAKIQLCTKDPGNCSGNPSPASCNGKFGNCTNPPTCAGGTAGVCTGAIAAACNIGTCGNKQPQTCKGAFQSCPTSPQTCSGPFNQSCVLPNTQTCQPQLCSVTYDPPGCNLLPPDPENPCAPVTKCDPPVCTPDPGTCSITKASCTAANASIACPAQPGACSKSGASCTQQSNCPDVGNCSTAGNLCSSVSDCAIIGGKCSTSGGACSKNTDCPNAGTCSGTPNPVCLFDTDCGICNNPVNTSCTSSAQCTAKPGTCNGSATSCSASTDCPITGGKCTQGGASCTLSSQCPPGTCDNKSGNKTGNACSSSTQCIDAKCNNPPNASCTQTSDCPDVFGVCQGSKINPPPACLATACNQGQTTLCCANILTCALTHSACNSNADCPFIPGVCSITNVACGFPGFDPSCAPIGQCSISNAQCACPFGTTTSCSTPACPNQPGPLAPNAAVCSTGGVGGVATATLFNDANTASKGVVCRHNNMTYTGSNPITAGPYNYPSGKYLTPITNGTGVDACPSTNHYASVPRHYWKSEVEWCDKKIAIAGDKWLGYGTDAGGTCQPGKDATHIYPRFYQFGAASYVNNYNTSAFERADLDIAKRLTAMYTHTWIDTKSQTHTITRNFDEEMTNYANWFAYYRTRIQAVKTVTSLTFTKLDDQYRIGFATLSMGLPKYGALPPDPAQFVNVADFAAAQKAAWFKQLFAITIPLKLETPTLDAMSRIGDYFLTGTSSELSGSTDPIILSCQKNWHMLFTDGFTNQALLPAAVGNQDDKVPTLPQTVTGLTAGKPWPHPFREDPNAGASNAASDYAMNYWVTDLRTSGANATNNVPATTKDPATWQHLNFAAMSLGTQGKLPIANQSLTENLLSAGTLQWPQPYPTVNKPDNSGVDDLWHAAINGRGRFVNAQSADELKLGMGQILQDITNQAGSRAGVGLASSSISLSNHAVYRVTFQPGWAGTLTKIDIDPVSGAELSDLWEAAQQLHNQLTILPPPDDKPWFTKRKIFTTNDSGAGVPFLWGNLSAAQQDSLAPGLPAVGQAVLEYLRGDPTNEGVSLGQFRVRGTGSFGENFLGDIVDSQAVYVGAPNAPYLDGNDPGYSSFVLSNKNRPASVYAGGNDGMLHAFKDTSGDEAWAYIPHDLYRPDNTGLGALAYQDGALPPFRHHYYVDSTPRIIDVNHGGGSSDWHTMLVGGLGKGGKSYYALDVTRPASIVDETSAAAQYLWTFTDADMGYSFGRPMLAKTRAFGGAWLMVVAAGYDNPTGVGTIFFVDAKTGALKTKMTTGFGNATSPSGLAHIAGYTKDFHNQLIEQIYGGDLYGNFWRFDVSDPIPGNWTVAKMAVFTDPGGKPQPVTTAPQIEVDIANGVDRWVFIGTGRLLDETDITDTGIANQQQTFYAIRDGTTTTPNPITAALQPRADFAALTDKLNGLSAKPAKGWYDDLPAGERIITGVQAALGVVAYVGTAPQDNPCLTGLPATLYVREFALGDSLLTDLGGNPIVGIGEVQGAVGLDIAIFSDSTGPQSASSLDIRIAVTAGTTGDVFFQRIKLPAVLAAHRMSWRLLGQ